MDLIKILKAHGIEGDAAETIEQAIKSDIHKTFIPKTQYNKKVQELDAVKTEADDLKARAELPNEFEGKYNDVTKELEALRGEYEAYKSDIATKHTKETISKKVAEELKVNGFTNDKVINLLLKDLDYDILTLEEGEVKGFDLSAFTKGYEEFKTVSNTEGTTATTPPTRVSEEPYTRERISSMTPDEINANWNIISKSLENLR